MRVQIKDLKPNPFRNMKNYPINEEKIQSLINSISGGFWDNIIARKKNGKFEIAYGHHRLIALQRLLRPDDYVDIPVKELDDTTMIRIMANENDKAWGTGPKIIDETIRVVMRYLKKSSLMSMITLKRGSRFRAFKKLPLPEPGESNNSVIAWQIFKWLGGNWTEQRVYSSIKRLELFDKGELDKETIESFPSEFTASKFITITKKIKATPKQQKRAAKRIIETGDFSESGMKSALLDEKYKDKTTEKDKEEKEAIKLKDFLKGCTKDIRKINLKLEELVTLKTQPDFRFNIHSGSIEVKEFICELKILISIIKRIGGDKK